MKWFKHETGDRNKIEAKLIRKNFGAEGYGIYQCLLEVIGEFVDVENYPKWGEVDPMHTIETLADECSVTSERLKEFLKFCDDKEIFEKKEGKLFCSLILRRLDNYAEQIERSLKVTTKPKRSKLSLIRKEKEESKKKNKIQNKEDLWQYFNSYELFETIKKNYPYRDYKFQFELMVDWWKTNKNKLPQNISAFSNWLKNTKEDEAMRSVYLREQGAEDTKKHLENLEGRGALDRMKTKAGLK